jgi:hypothetical protein
MSFGPSMPVPVQPLSLTGYNRSINPKDRGCSTLGCDVKGYYCEVHHVTGHATCRTAVNQLTFSCGTQHRIVQPGGLSTRKNAHADIEWIPPAHLDRGQPLINTLHHPKNSSATGMTTTRTTNRSGVISLRRCPD